MGTDRTKAGRSSQASSSLLPRRTVLGAAFLTLFACLFFVGNPNAAASAADSAASSQVQRGQAGKAAKKRAMLRLQVRRCRKIGGSARRARCLTKVQVKRCRLTQRGKQRRLCIRRARSGRCARDPQCNGTQEPSDRIQPGLYRGKVGTFARMVFTVSADGALIKGLNAGVKTNCLRSSDSFLTETKVVSTAPQEQDPAAELKVRNGRFSGSGQDSNGVSWEIEGSVGPDGKAAGKFEASLFESVYNPFVYGGFDGQICSGSGDWNAKLSDD